MNSKKLGPMFDFYWKDFERQDKTEPLQRRFFYGDVRRLRGVTLDVGCGDMKQFSDSEEMSPGESFLVGLDISEKALRMSKKFAKKCNVILCAVEFPPIKPDTAGHVFCIETTQYTDTKKTLSEIRRVAKKGANIRLTFTHKDEKQYGHENLSTTDESGVKKLLEEAGLTYKEDCTRVYTCKELNIASEGLHPDRKSTIYVECTK